MSNRHSSIFNNDSHQPVKISFSLLASALGMGRNTSNELNDQDIEFSRVSINSRTLEKGDVFVAIKGEQFDGHEFVKQAEKQGACGLIVEKRINSELPQLCVEDTRRALGQIALLWRLNFSLPVIAITGSCGKTTVKEMTSAIMRSAFNENSPYESVLATRGNLNNDIGVPLTLLRLNEKHKAAVIELGANHIGEIEQLVKMVQPDVAVITNAAQAHIEGFGSIEGVAQAKSEIYGGLAKNKRGQGVAIINVDDVFADQWISYNQQAVQDGRVKLLTFGLKTAADVSADYQQKKDGIELLLKTPAGTQTVFMQQFGVHNIYNALAATAASIATGCSLLDIKNGLENFTNVSGRLERKAGVNGAVIFDDTYNANPGSVKAGIEALNQAAQQQENGSIKSETILILGDMAELGEESKQLHYQLGIDIANLEVMQLITVGEMSYATHKAYCSQIKKIMNKEALASHYSTKTELMHDLQNNFHDNDLILVKGSRTMAMESVVEALLDVPFEKTVMEVVH